MINHFISIIKKIKQKTPDVKTNRGLNKSFKKKTNYILFLRNSTINLANASADSIGHAL
jgi:hypothetical protein